MGNQGDQAGLVGQDGQKEKEGEQILVVVKMGKRGSKLPCHSSYLSQPPKPAVVYEILAYFGPFCYFVTNLRILW